MNKKYGLVSLCLLSAVVILLLCTACDYNSGSEAEGGSSFLNDASDTDADLIINSDNLMLFSNDSKKRFIVITDGDKEVEAELDSSGERVEIYSVDKNIEGYQDTVHMNISDYFDYENELLPYIEKDESLVGTSKESAEVTYYNILPYTRATYSSENGELKKLKTDTVNRSQIQFRIVYSNYTDEDIILDTFPTICRIFKDDNGNEYVDTNVYVNEQDGKKSDDRAVYLNISRNKQAKDKSEYLSAVIPAHGKVDVTLCYIFDHDLFLNSYLCFETKEGKRYTPLFSEWYL